MIRDARRRHFDVVAVSKSDRFARSTSHLLKALDEFKALGIDFVSLTESIDTSAPIGKMVFTILGTVGEFERCLSRITLQIVCTAPNDIVTPALDFAFARA
jgi:DNA invertase Pin-like site-specific DNA recombinase